MTDAVESPPAPPAAEPAATAAAPGPVRMPFRFEGDAAEYFRIWIVNLFLSVVTLGLYSPWAKVRKKRYLYGNTWVAGANFDYHGNPVAILKGRAIAVTAFIVYSIVAEFYPSAGYAIVLGALAASPWLIVRTLQFNALNSSYRNLRLHFDGRFPEAFAAVAPFAAWPMLGLALGIGGDAPDAYWVYTVPTLAFLAVYPRVIGALKVFHVAHLSYGTARFHIRLSYRAFYRVYALAGAMALGGIFVLFMIAMPVFFRLSTVGIYLAQGVYLAGAAVFLAYTRSRITNLVFNAAGLIGGIRFVSTLSARELAKLYFVNLLAITVSLGLLVPWAVVRTARYRASRLALECSGDLDSVLASISRPVGAAGDEMGEFFDVDLSL